MNNNKIKPLIFFCVLLIAAGCTTGPNSAVDAGQTGLSQDLFASAEAPAAVENTPFVVAVPPASAEEEETTFTYPPEGVGPESYPQGINPLTGLPPAQASLLNRRPVIVKVENMPRERSRPQWGLPQADLVFEYYIEYGDTRFSVVYYGQQPEQVGPIRSARHVDKQLIQMYRSFFVFGGAYPELYDEMVQADYGDRIIREGPNTSPALFRFEPDQNNELMVNLGLLEEVYATYGMDNSRQPLQGLAFNPVAPQGGQPASRVYARFSGAVYNRWDYDPQSGTYLRFADAQNDVNNVEEVYAPLMDAASGQQVAMENVVIILTRYYQLNGAEVYDIPLQGNGPAFVARDGQIYAARWERADQEMPLRLMLDNGKAFPLKPGRTWFELMGESTQQSVVEEAGWRFVLRMP
ncbi:hypothetical protein ADN00_13255 [Ornatilinea apprima]|uniref:Lipoprotein YerB n=1 Tax=Ornatilinea apprima TaxID=1134406 RepID=A0A0P6XR41_9CHLR|nr:DUF3048 domain-containing protein [Ornatilinea apprima]KPL74808.1 hypothetical protein ADN00_13255 [Ornatilinea apprima]